MFVRYIVLCMFIYFDLYDNILGLSQFSQMLPSMLKGEIVGNMANQSSKMRYVVFIYGNMCFTI